MLHSVLPDHVLHTILKEAHCPPWVSRTTARVFNVDHIDKHDAIRILARRIVKAHEAVDFVHGYTSDWSAMANGDIERLCGLVDDQGSFQDAVTTCASSSRTKVVVAVLLQTFEGRWPLRFQEMGTTTVINIMSCFEYNCGVYAAYWWTKDKGYYVPRLMFCSRLHAVKAVECLLDEDVVSVMLSSYDGSTWKTCAMLYKQEDGEMSAEFSL